MRFSLLLASLLVASVAHAAPAADRSEDTDRSMIDKSLIGQLQQVRQSVVERTSDLVVTAVGFLGVPYRRGGNTAETGFDCSGFVRAMYNQTVGHLLPRRAEEQAAATEKIDRNELKPGDLVFFNTMRRAFSHVGIYVGEGKFIHSPRTGAQVRVEDMNGSYWKRRFDGARRVLSTDDDDEASRAAVK
jgi:cell wall-associated NlpC family hydrolase